MAGFAVARPALIEGSESRDVLAVGDVLLAILLGRTRRRVGFSPAISRALVTAGVVGLLSTAAYLLAIITATDESTIDVIGLIERGATHPFLIGLLRAGASIWRLRTLDTLSTAAVEAGQAAPRAS